MQVLHFHLSDQCRFAIESHRYPQLTANLIGAQAGHYTQPEVRELVAYAADRGIRVIPCAQRPSPPSLPLFPAARPSPSPLPAAPELATAVPSHDHTRRRFHLTTD